MAETESGALSGTTRVTLITGEPGPTRERWVYSVNITNLDTAAVTVILELRRGGVWRVLRKAVLAVNGTLSWTNRAHGDLCLPSASYLVVASLLAAPAGTSPDFVACWGYER